MNYEPNTTNWKRGDIVIHDADAKRADMLMRVTGYGKDGLCHTRYVDQRRKNSMRRTVWKNELKYLHDPKRFGIQANTQGQPRREEERT